MAHAWLDSLSEDWISQPGSDNSDIQLPPPKTGEETKLRSQESPSRIPRRAGGAGSSIPLNADNSVLNERSANEINIASQRLPSKLSQEIKASRGDPADRCISGGQSNGSIVHNTVHHQSPSGKTNGHTPEWKRRLVLGDMQYGEQRDLFCSAANGLQEMFKPPETNTSDELDGEGDEPQHESTMPSSPPLYTGRRASTELALEVNILEEGEGEDLQYPNDVTPSPSPRRLQREVKYTLNVEDSFVVDTPSNRLAGAQAEDVEIYRDRCCLSATSAVGNNTRKTSGQSDTRNEDFSPIFIGKHSDEEGKVEFSPFELPADQLQQKLERLRLNQQLWDSETPVEDAPEGEEQHKSLDSTEEFARQGGFINFRRGGRSNEGSFRHRGLSPGFSVDTSEMLPEESLQASTPKQFPTARIQTRNTYQKGQEPPSPSLPRAPFPSPEKRQIRSENQANAPPTSPLKLFGPYDTFTNQTLLRRISQFEEGMSGTNSGQSPTSSVMNSRHPSHTHTSDGRRRVSEFGAGDLEGYEFSGDLSNVADDESSISYYDKENLSPQPPLSSSPSVGFRPREHSPYEVSDIIVRRRRDKSLPTPFNRHAHGRSTSHQLRKSIGLGQGAPGLDGAWERDGGPEGKRPRTSPSKDPTPKRRRTLHRSDIAYGRESLAGIDVASRKIQCVTGSNRQDSRGAGFQLAGAQALASRSILQPRTPSGRLYRTSRRQEEALADGQRRSPHRDETGNIRLPGEHPADGERKPSIRTQDFVDQAAQIMAMIRSQVRPPGLASVEESVVDNDRPSPGLSDDLGSESTKEPLSRPPSREGKPSVSRLPQRQVDPDLVDRLKKYQEASDMGDIISSSMRSVGLAKEAIRAAQETRRQIDDHPRSSSSAPLPADEGEMISDIPNVRISTNPTHNGGPASPSRDYPSTGSGQFTSRSFPTGSSRGSDSRKVIMPDSVSHLIPERVGSMRLDKDNNIWVKSKEMQTLQETNVSSSDSEDDPFASIPDLSVDLTKEMQNLRLTTARKETVDFALEQREPPLSPTAAVQSQANRGFVTLSPDGRLSSGNSSPAQDELQKLQEKGADGADHREQDGLEPEASGDDSKIPDALAKIKRRNITISFSSPVASVIQDVQPEDLDSLEDDESLELPEKPEVSPTRSQVYMGVGKPVLKNGRGRPRASSRHVPATESGFIPRPVSRIDEQDEDSTVELPHHDNNQLSIIGETSLMSHKTPDARHTSLSFILNHTPAHGALSVRGDDSAMIGQNVGKLSLSPLSEFTMNHSDQSFGFEVSYVMGRRHMETGDGNKRVMSMTIRNLVDKLSEVEPSEAYWEDLAELDLQDKQLSSLHMLDEFCGKIVRLDASKNALGHLDGVPPTVRELKVSQNMLTELTSWDHLQNLQYVDVSGNEVTSLSALKNLVHLRSIRADNNQLTSLDELDRHDGLLSLRARGNQIEYVDFANLQLKRLTELDVAGNQIRSVRNVELLPELSRLKLSGNRLETFTVSGTVTSLRQLDVTDNDLSELDLSNLPGLHSLYADRNCIKKLNGSDRARRLDSLSLREQRGDEPMDLCFLSAAYEIRKLFLSGNYLGVFDPRVDFLNLQLLELANCGLQTLPEKVGQLMPNLRTLNLNFNGISDLSPLRFIPRLKKLLAAGNRLADSTAVTELLIDFPHLTQLDLRDNLVTLGFYAPLQVLVSTREGGAVDPFVLPEADGEKDAAFARRLDEATRQRRRLHQVVFAASCKRLRMLDGLRIKRHEVLARDDVYMALVADGLLPGPDGEVSEEQATAIGTENRYPDAAEPVKSSPGSAEDVAA
ncbi:Septation initiation network scaffold protein-like protein [Hapsidospora chrysogenum ATCC 11550]|uniref:Septation initiation network scaffold protein-like protein n=1 Tax=Hapsidospora chrysogenum (strain ATCC 11550 / CBS 779.69 / DSM 880 / IAM 14645 / JCM 23072 / IMI 49137) TaxID=857340 RepID=A0A086TGT0_HAPC1|nr:Septation initiation network scaffold protein-like protein [Hapsidospora chrysogenum ATCC 11550]